MEKIKEFRPSNFHLKDLPDPGGNFHFYLEQHLQRRYHLERIRNQFHHY